NLRVYRLDVARKVGRILRLQTAAGLCAGRRAEHWTDRVRGRVARMGDEGFAAEFTAYGKGERTLAHVERAVGVDVGAALVEAITADVDRGGAVRTQRGVERMAQVVIEGI